MLLGNKTSFGLRGLKPQPGDGKDIKFLFLILQAIENLNGSLYNVFTHLPAVFTVGTTTGAPVNGQSSWTISTINVIGKNPVFLKNGLLLTSGTDYTFNNSTGVFTLATGTFATSEVYTVIY